MFLIKITKLVLTNIKVIIITTRHEKNLIRELRQTFGASATTKSTYNHDQNYNSLPSSKKDKLKIDYLATRPFKIRIVKWVHINHIKRQQGYSSLFYGD